jgi:hypothetical protein
MVQHDYVPKPFSPDNYWRKSGNTYRSQALIAAVHESAYGTCRTSNRRPSMSAFGGRADIAFDRRNVRF